MVAPFCFAGTFAGSRLFGRLDERRFRRFALGLMIAVSVAALVA